MRKILLFTAIILTTNCFAQISNPRETMQTFLKSMVRIKTNEGDATSNYQKAISTLNLAHIESQLQDEIGKRYSEQLIFVLDRMRKVDYEKIPTEPKSDRWIFDQQDYKSTSLEISIEKVDKEWLVSKKTLDSLSSYQSILESKSIVSGVVELRTLTDTFRESLPESFNQKIIGLANWQWFGLFILFCIAYILHKIFDVLLAFTLNKYFVIVKRNSSEKLIAAINPLGRILFIYIISKTLYLIQLNASTLTYSQRLLAIVMSFFAVIFGHKVIKLFSYYAAQKAQLTETKFDDILIPLLTKTAFVVLYIFGGILIANSLTINVSGIVAGLGIGGLAFAFAAKDTLANFFGSIMLILDRPFDIGDVVITNGLEGVVDEVGFRSTRIRTFNDSVISVSNGQLMNQPIENLGKRRFRRLKTSLGLEYDTPPQKVEAFCEGIRQLIIKHPWTKKDSFHVYFTNFGASSLDIQLVCYWETADYSRELAEKHRLMLDILRLADSIGVSFAFPTQTVHMFKGEANEKTETPEEYREFGIAQAAEVISKPIALKNPRSNATDKAQFGENDV